MSGYSGKRQNLPSLFGVSLRDALADALTERFGRGRQKKAARELALSADAARRACEGRPSMWTFEEAMDGRPDLYVEIGIRKYGDAFRQAFREQLAKEQRRDAETSATIHSVGRRLHLVRGGDPVVGDGPTAGQCRAEHDEGGGPAGDDRGPTGLAAGKRGGRP